eukprot:TRINITY_DN74949_c0_g1_i1.p1 TRINITY_DN74949_c0_g1~~TRINITY_DN74949_c0_g1_i1.p1  ORF type:complete len:854 (-),score=103.45 TRINITY_DN74949_c0_g1_i1:184-2745(-)
MAASTAHPRRTIEEIEAQMQTYSQSLQHLRAKLDEDLKGSRSTVPVFSADTGATPAVESQATDEHRSGETHGIFPPRESDVDGRREYRPFCRDLEDSPGNIASFNAEAQPPMSEMKGTRACDVATSAASGDGGEIRIQAREMMFGGQGDTGRLPAAIAGGSPIIGPGRGLTPGRSVPLILEQPMMGRVASSSIIARAGTSPAMASSSMAARSVTHHSPMVVQARTISPMLQRVSSRSPEPVPTRVLRSWSGTLPPHQSLARSASPLPVAMQMARAPLPMALSGGPGVVQSPMPVPATRRFDGAPRPPSPMPFVGCLSAPTTWPARGESPIPFGGSARPCMPHPVGSYAFPNALGSPCVASPHVTAARGSGVAPQISTASCGSYQPPPMNCTASGGCPGLQASPSSGVVGFGVAALGSFVPAPQPRAPPATMEAPLPGTPAADPDFLRKSLTASGDGTQGGHIFAAHPAAPQAVLRPHSPHPWASPAPCSCSPQLGGHLFAAPPSPQAVPRSHSHTQWAGPAVAPRTCSPQPSGSPFSFAYGAPIDCSGARATIDGSAHYRAFGRAFRGGGSGAYNIGGGDCALAGAAVGGTSSGAHGCGTFNGNGTAECMSAYPQSPCGQQSMPFGGNAMWPLSRSPSPQPRPPPWNGHIDGACGMGNWGAGDWGGRHNMSCASFNSPPTRLSPNRICRADSRGPGDRLRSRAADTAAEDRQDGASWAPVVRRNNGLDCGGGGGSVTQSVGGGTLGASVSTLPVADLPHVGSPSTHHHQQDGGGGSMSPRPLPPPPPPLGGSLPPTHSNLFVDAADFASPLVRAAMSHHNGEDCQVLYPESFDGTGDPTWLRPPFGPQHQVMK